MKGFDQIISTLGDGYTSGSAMSVLGKSIPGSEIDWAFAEMNSYSVRMEVAAGHAHVDALIGLVDLPGKLDELTIGSKSLVEKLHSLPQVLAGVLVLVCIIAAIVSRFFGVSISDLIAIVRAKWSEFGVCFSPINE